MHKIILAGYGGQGMLLCGQILAYAAMTEGSNVTWLPTYGPEMRGGAAACSVVISDKPIGSPVVKYADAVVAMSQPAFDKYHASVADGGYLIYNSDLVTAADKRDGIKYIDIDFSHLAMELGNPKTANMIVLGSVNELLKCVKQEALHTALEYKFSEKAKLIDINKKAIELGTRSCIESHF